jgi:hypothetical protein
LEGETRVRDRLEKVRDRKLESEVDRRIRSLDREHEAFVDTVKDEFKKVNEFRGALSDLSRDMWTRREGEAAVDASKLAVDAALKAATAVTDKLDEQITHLRSPNDERTGAERKAQQISTKTLVWAGFVVTFGASVFAVVATEIIKLVGG